ncbi:MAG: class I SAM-dependent methyltransferase [Sphingomonas sp.]|jgi:malonyl-CoA O-methyltransferase|uniref:class I SAM-dependent methyltransferase n=1 Tax=Sphingomonas sp. TaxID=28214 RepID=UPI003563B0CA
MTALAAREAYRLWAPTYVSETAITALECGLVEAMTPPLRGRRLLDAGCGTGRRLRGTDAASMVGVDLSPEMLDAGDVANDPAISLLVGDVRALPLPGAAFDITWCRLVIGHLPDCVPVYAELARVTVPGGMAIVSDFHPRAHDAGHRRTFRSDGVVHEVEHHVHALTDHRAAAAMAGLHLVEIREAAIGPAVRPFYDRADRLALYDEHVGLPVVLALAFLREG